MQEIWKEIWGLPKYLVSNFGRVATMKQDSDCLKILNVNPKKGAYKKFEVKKKKYSIHREVAKAFVPNPLQLPQVNHLDGDKQNNQSTNLEWCTNSSNQKHARDLGLTKTGESCTFSKLTQEQVNFIRDNFLVSYPIYTVTQLAEKFKVHRTTISKIKNGHRWKSTPIILK